MFLRDLYAGTRAAELEVTGWTPDQKRAFCDSQFTLQDSYYRQQWPDASYDVVEWGDREAGRFLVDAAPSGWLVLDIALVPQCRGAGLGTLLLQWVQAKAAASGAAVHMSVELDNPARHLYERLGFEVHAKGDLRDEMVWRAEASGAQAWEAFAALALDDQGVRDALADAVDDADLCVRAVSLGLARRLAFGSGDVQAALREKRMSWIERGVR
jgi:GNAT superfamily N-acetyltransferase